MLWKLSRLILAGVVGVSLLWAAPVQAIDKQKAPRHYVPVKGTAHDPEIIVPSVPSRPIRRSLDDPIGSLYMAGSTWYDYQHNGSAGKMINVDAAGKVSVVWMNGLDELSANRYVYYNVWDLDSWAFLYDTIGIRIDASQRAGYVSQTTNADGFCFPGFHQILTENVHAAASIDYIAYENAFTTVEPDYCFEGASDLEIIWPKIDMDINGVLHMMSTESVPEEEVRQRIYYSRGVPEFDADGFGIDIHWDPLSCGGFEMFDTVTTITPDIACSRHSERIVVAYNHSIFGPDEYPEAPGWHQRFNEVYLRISENGGLDWGEPVNVTQWTPWDPDCFASGGDTLECDRDTLRAYTDCSVLLDEEDYIHVAFTTPPFWWHLPGSTDTIYTTYSASLIWHWSEATGLYSLLAKAWFEADPPSECGAWQYRAQRPSLAIDPETGYLYCSYMQYDTLFSTGGYPLSDAYVTVSTNGGVNWAVGTNVTNTMPDVIPTPAGDCLNERDITVARLVTDGILHMEYVLDKDAGACIQTPVEGVATLNPVYYQRIPVDSIPTAPLMENYPMHWDSSGWDTAPVHARELPSRFVLHQNYPNPFNPTTTLQFDLARRAVVTLKVYNVLGREVSTLLDEVPLTAGVHQVKFDGSGLASGVYIYQLLSDGYVASKKMVLMK